MLRTVEAVIDEQGNVRLLEHVTLSGARKALVTILEETPASSGGSSARAPANPVAGIHPPPAPPPPPRTPPAPRPPTAVAIDLPPSRPDIAATVVPETIRPGVTRTDGGWERNFHVIRQLG